MGHKPDQKARRKRREREAAKSKKNAPPKPRITVREMIDTKREMIAKNRADLEAKLEEAPEAVRDEYRRCMQEINRLLSGIAPRGKIENAVLYPPKDGKKTLSGAEIVWLRVLLTHPANGWEVSQAAALRKSDHDDAQLLFNFNPYGD